MSEDEGEVKDDGVRGEEEVDGVVSKRETYSSIQLIKIPLSKKPVKFRLVTLYPVTFTFCILRLSTLMYMYIECS